MGVFQTIFLVCMMSQVNSYDDRIKNFRDLFNSFAKKNDTEAIKNNLNTVQEDILQDKQDFDSLRNVLRSLKNKNRRNPDPIFHILPFKREAKEEDQDCKLQLEKICLERIGVAANVDVQKLNRFTFGKFLQCMNEKHDEAVKQKSLQEEIDELKEQVKTQKEQVKTIPELKEQVETQKEQIAKMCVQHGIRIAREVANSLHKDRIVIWNPRDLQPKKSSKMSWKDYLLKPIKYLGDKDVHPLKDHLKAKDPFVREAVEGLFSNYTFLNETKRHKKFLDEVKGNEDLFQEFKKQHQNF